MGGCSPTGVVYGWGVMVLAYFEALAYAELGSGVDAVELAQAAYGDVVLGGDGAQGVALLDFVGGSS